MNSIYIFSFGSGRTGAPRRLLGLSDGLNEVGEENYFVVSKRSEIAVSSSFPGKIKEIFIPKRLERSLSPKSILDCLHLITSLLVFYFVLISRFLSFDKKLVVLRSTLSGLTHFPLYFLPNCRVVLDIDYEPNTNFLIKMSRYISLKRASFIVLQYKNALTDSLDGKESLWVDYSKVATILPGISLDSKSEGLDFEFKYRDAEIELVHIGKICTRKNQMFTLQLVSSLKRLHGDIINVRFIGGIQDPDYYQLMIDFIKESSLDDNVSFIPWHEDPFATLNKNSIIIVPSLQEGVPNTAQESMLRGFFVVCVSVGGLPDIVIHRQTGYIFSNFNLEEWVESLYHLSLNFEEKDRILMNAQKFAINRFSLLDFCKKYQSILLNVN